MTELSLADLVRPELSELAAYVPHAGHFRVRLDANEAPPLLSRAARMRLHEATRDVAYERYPDARIASLRTAIAARMGALSEQIIVGSGSDEIIALLLTVLAKPRGRAPAATIVTTTPTFVMYRMSARVRGMRVMEVPLDAAWDLDVDGLVKAIDVARPNIVFIASPNNPTGNLVSRDRLDALIDSAKGALVVVDEAYVDYAPRDQLDLLHSHSNVAILRTLSKVGFAALRVGWLAGPPELCAEVDKARQPYNVGTIAQVLAEVALGEIASDVRNVVEGVVSERARLGEALASMPGISVTPSDANFVWIRTEAPAERVQAELASSGVLVRSFHARGGRLAQQLRVTVGTEQENDLFLKALGRFA